MPSVKIGNERIYFDVYGSELDLSGKTLRQKPTIVALHGAIGLDHTYLAPLLESLSDIAQIILPDHRGNGRSTGKNPEDWNIKRWAADVREFCDVLGLEKPIVLGDSSGAHIAFQYAVDYPDHPGALIQIHAEARMPRERMMKAYEAKGGVAARKAAEKFVDTLDENAWPEYVKHCLCHCAKKPISMDLYRHARMHSEVQHRYNTHEMFKFNLLPELHKIKCPTLLVANGLNPVHLKQNALEAYQAMQQDLVQFHCFDDAGLLYVDVLEEMLDLIRAFIVDL